jgi:cholesterol transport system auxiliary component
MNANRRFVWLFTFFACLLGGCAGVGRDEMPAAVYDFGPPAVSGEDVDAGRRTEHLALEVRAVPWLDGLGIDYRLVYGDPLRRNQYVDSRWAAPPARLLAQQLRRRLGFVAAEGFAGDCVLRVELQEFSHVFTAPRVSHGVLQGQVSLIDGKHRLIARRTVDIERPARSADAAGGARALAEAGEELGRQLAGWLEREGGLEVCRPGKALP